MKYSKEENFLQVQEKIRKRDRMFLYWMISFSGSFACCFLLLFTLSFSKVFLDTSDKIIWNEGYNRSSYTADVCVRPRDLNFFEEFSWFSNFLLPENIISMSYFLECFEDVSMDPKHYELYANSDTFSLTISFGEENRGSIDTWCFGGRNLEFPHEKASFFLGKEIYLDYYDGHCYANFYAHDFWFSVYGTGYSKEDFLKVVESIIK